jgi:electron transfer flavoprotein beta subunit
MKIIVCVKHVAAVEDDVEFTSDARNVDPEFLDHDLNEWDACAVEEALRLRDAGGPGEVVVITVGDEEASASLRRGVAMGADRAIRIWSEALENADALAVASALAPAVRAEAPDLVLTGAQSSDNVQGATGGVLAELLELPAVAVVRNVDVHAAAGRAVVHRELEGGLIDVMEIQTPAVLTIQTGINEPRYVNLRALKQADQHAIEDVGAGEVQPLSRVRRMFLPARNDSVEMLGGDAAEVARKIAELVGRAQG